MSYDEVEIEDMAWNEELQAFTYSCPCGDLFQITLVSGAQQHAGSMVSMHALPGSPRRSQMFRR